MPRRRLERSRTDRMICGVCGGIADYLEVDPVLARLAAVGLTVVAPPVGVVAYIVCCLVVPEEAASPSAPSATSSQHAEPPGGAGPEGSAAGESSDLPPPGESGAGPAPSDAPAPSETPGIGVTAPSRAATASAGDTNPGMVGGFILLGIGVLFLMINLDFFDWWYFRYVRWRYLWPLCLILIGLWIVGRAVIPGGPNGGRRRQRGRRRHAG